MKEYLFFVYEVGYDFTFWLARLSFLKLLNWSIILLPCSYIANAQVLHGDHPEMRFRHLNANLNNNRIESILQDSYGYVWIGTLGGLHKYDGINIAVYLATDDSTSINGNRIMSLFEDSQKRLWIGTENGVNQYDRKMNRFVRILSKKTEFVATADPTLNRIRAIVQNESRIIWIGSERGGLFFFDESIQSFRPYSSKNPKGEILNRVQVVSLFAETNGILWIGTTNDGLFRLNTNSGAIKRYVHNPNDHGSIAGNYIEDMLVDKMGRLWLATHEDGLDRLNLEEDTLKFVHYRSNPANSNSLINNDVTNVYEDRAGNIWVCNENGGLYRYNNNENNFFRYLPNPSDPFSISNISVRAVFEDNQGRLWVGSNLEGIDIMDKYAFKFGHYYQSENSKSINNNIIRSILEDDEGNLWIGTDGGGLNYFDRRKNEFSYYKHTPNNPNSISSNAVLALAKDRNHNLWVGTWRGGVNIFNQKTKTFTQLAPRNQVISKVFYLMKDREDNLWIATQSGGVSKYLWKENKIVTYLNDPHDPQSIGDNDVVMIYEDSEGRIWIATEFNGLNQMVIDEAGIARFKRYMHTPKDSSSLASNNVNHIFEDSKKNLWIATEGGLSKLLPEKGRFKNYTVADGLESNHVKSLTEDSHNNLWLGTAKGISRFNPDKKSFRNYTDNDGLQNGEFARYSVYKTSTGELVFGGANGFNLFNPDSIGDNSFTPEVYFTGFRIFNQPVEVGKQDSPLKQDISETKELILSYKQSVFSFDFIAINYTNPHLNQYAFRMEGFEKHWNYVGTQRTATYTNLDPGKYTFHVIASNSDGFWNEIGNSIVITITPPIWQTIWFRLAAIVVFAGLVYLGVRYRIRRLKIINTQLEGKVNERTIQLNKLVYDLKEKQSEVEAANEELTKTQEELKTFNDQLDKRVQDRTSELVKANQELDRFVYSASHDLSAPLKSILGLVNIARVENKNEALDIYLDHMDRSVAKLEVVIQNLIQFSRNMNIVVKKTFSFRDIVKEVLEDLKYYASVENLKILEEYVCDDSINSDYPRMKIILTNLLTNAIKYRDLTKKEHLIKIRFLNMPEGHTIELEDNGIGIEEKLQSKIFEMFFRATATSNGSGLGLFIVKDIVEKLKGTIHVESVLGVSTCFRITLPKN